MVMLSLAYKISGNFNFILLIFPISKLTITIFYQLKNNIFILATDTSTQMKFLEKLNKTI